MAEYRKKPVVINAIQFMGIVQNGDVVGAMFDIEDGDKSAQWLIDATDDGTINIDTVEGNVVLVIKTLEGQHIAAPLDFIIQGVQGELYPCKHDIFNQTYEPVTPT